MVAFRLNVMGRAVLVAYYFPPLVGIASERAAALGNHLAELGWDPVVVTARNGFYHRVSGQREPRYEVIRTPSVELSRLLRRGYGAVTQGSVRDEEMTVRAIRAGGVGSMLRRIVRDFVYVPDAQVGWIPFAASAADEVLRRSGSDRVVFSTSVPYSAHFAAMRAARRQDVAWVAELRDPWSTGSAPNRTHSSLRQRVDEGLERRILLTADHVVVTSEATRAELLDVTSGLRPERISVVKNGFEPMPVGEVPGRDAPMTVLYAGTVAPGEDMAPVLASLDAVHARHPGAFRLHVLGPGDAWNASERRPWLQLGGIVSPRAAREAMARSSVLLLVQRHAAYRKIVPGKALEYIGVRRPILALIPPDTEMAALIDGHADARIVDADMPGRVVGAVERLLSEHRDGQLQEPRVPESVTAPLARREQAKKLTAIFEMVSR